jgi:hypothetical protein
MMMKLFLAAVAAIQIAWLCLIGYVTLSVLGLVRI